MKRGIKKCWESAARSAWIILSALLRRVREVFPFIVLLFAEALDRSWRSRTRGTEEARGRSEPEPLFAGVRL